MPVRERATTVTMIQRGEFLTQLTGEEPEVPEKMPVPGYQQDNVITPASIHTMHEGLCAAHNSHNTTL